MGRRQARSSRKRRSDGDMVSLPRISPAPGESRYRRIRATGGRPFAKNLKGDHRRIRAMTVNRDKAAQTFGVHRSRSMVVVEPCLAPSQGAAK